MMIVNCTCGVQLQVDEAYIGQNVQCSQCGQMLSIMAPATQQPMPQPTQQTAPQQPMPQQPQAPYPSQPYPTQQPADPTAGLQPPPPAGDQTPLADFIAPAPGAPAGSMAVRKQSSGAALKWLKNPWLIGSVVGGIVLIIVLMFLLGGGSGSAGGKLDLTYLPRDTKIVHHVRVAALLESADKGRMPEDKTLKARAEAAERKLGFKLDQVESLTIGYRDKDADEVLKSHGWTMLGRTPIDFVGVVRMKKKHDWKSVMSWVGKPDTSATGIVNVANNYALYFPDQRTCVFGTRADVQTAASGKQRPDTAFRTIGKNDEISIAIDLSATGLLKHSRWKTLKATMEAEMYAVASNYSGSENDHMERVQCATTSAANKIKSGSEIGRSWSPKQTHKYQPRVTTKGRVVTFRNPSWRSTVGLSAFFNLLNRAAWLEIDKLHSVVVELQSEVETRRMVACSTLANTPVDKVRQREVCSWLHKIVKDNDRASYAAADALGRWGTKESVPVLTSQLNSTNQLTRRRCLDALAKLAEPSSISAIAARLADQGDRYTARRALIAFGQQAEAAVIPFLGHADSQTKDAAIAVLAKIGGKRSISALAPLLNDPRLKYAAQRATREIKTRHKL